MTEVRTIPIHPTNTLDEPEFFAEANCKGSREHQLIIEREANENQIPDEAIKVARLICQFCNVFTECMDYGLRISEEYGMYGGITQQGRKQLAKDNNIKQIKRPRPSGYKK